MNDKHSIAFPRRLRATADGDESRQTLPRRLPAAPRADQILGDVQGAWLIPTRALSADQHLSLGAHHITRIELHALPECSHSIAEVQALKEGREPDLSDYKDFKLTCENVGFQMLSRMGWEEGAGLGAHTGGILNPVDKCDYSHEESNCQFEWQNIFR